MFFKKISFNEVNSLTWDHWLEQLAEATYLHSSAWLKYISEFYDVVENASFCLLDAQNFPLAICPLIVNIRKTRIGDISVIGDNALGVPALLEVAPSFRKKILNEIINIYTKYAEKNNIVSIQMVRNPLTIKFNKQHSLGLDRCLELERFHFFQRVANTVVISLVNSEDTILGNMGKYHRRHINRAIKKGVKIKVFDNEANTDEVNNCFSRFQNEHFKSAGRLTRPQKTWDLMSEMIFDNKAVLFVSHLNDKELSYLFCGQYHKMAFGWSQVNVKEFEREYLPRHILEWKAFSYYKIKGYKFYEVGDRYYGPTPLYIPTEKVISIGVFKERYGGILLPKVYWKGYFNADIMKEDLTIKFKSFINSSNTISI